MRNAGNVRKTGTLPTVSEWRVTSLSAVAQDVWRYFAQAVSDQVGDLQGEQERQVPLSFPARHRGGVHGHPDIAGDRRTDCRPDSEGQSGRGGQNGETFLSQIPVILPAPRPNPCRSSHRRRSRTRRFRPFPPCRGWCRWGG